MRRAVARVTVCMSECVCVQWDNVALGGGFNEYGLLIGAKIYAVHIHTRSRFLSHVRINRIIDEKNK